MPAPATDAPRPDVSEWVSRAQAGDLEAFDWLYAEYAVQVIRTVRALSGHDAEDVAHDAFVIAWERIDTYEPRAGKSFGAWLVTIALNVARSTRRRAGRLRLVEPGTLDHASATPDADDAMGQRRLLELLAALPERDRAVVALRYAAGMSAAETAESLGIAEAHVRKICQRRRAELLDGMRSWR